MGSIEAKQKLPSPNDVSGMVPFEVESFEAPMSELTKPIPAETATAADSSSTIENPGSFVELHKSCKDVQPTIIDGAHMLINNSLSNHFQTSHRLSIINCGSYSAPAAADTAGYKFSTTFVGDQKQCGIPPLPGAQSIESFPILFGEIDTAGSVTANVVHHLTPSWRLRYSGQFLNKLGGARTMGQITADWLAERWTSSLTLMNLNDKYQPEICVVQHLHAITPDVAIGGELCFNNADRTTESIMMLGGVPRLTGAGAIRVRCGPSLWTATSSLHGIHVCSYRKCSDSLSFGIESDLNWVKREAISSVAFQVDGGQRSGGVVFRGRVDTAGRVGSVLEKRLDPLPVTFSLSALIHHGKRQFRLGCALVLNR